MPAAAKPKNETLRQAAVERLQLSGVPEEECFDRVTRLAAKLLNMPSAAFTLIDGDMQLLKSRVGFGPVRGTLRRTAFCAHVVKDDAPLLVEDLSTDRRFSDNPMVTGELHMRFYAGVPVRSPELLPVGALCVLDSEPRTATGDELQTLSDLAAIIERELVLRSLLRTDPLTGLYNRRHYEVEIEREWRRASRSKAPFAHILVNIDQMGDYNDVYGHEKGNTALRQLATALAQRFLRSSDLLVRMGGDEFLVLLPETGEAAALQLGEEIRKLVFDMDLSHPYAEHKRLTASVGCAAAETEADFAAGADALLGQTRIALSRAKAAGRNRVSGAESVAA